MRGKLVDSAEKWPHCRAGRSRLARLLEIHGHGSVSQSKAGRVESEGSRFVASLAGHHPAWPLKQLKGVPQGRCSIYRWRIERICGLPRLIRLAGRVALPHLDCRTKKVECTLVAWSEMVVELKTDGVLGPAFARVCLSPR